MIFALLNVYLVDIKAVLEDGWFQGINSLAWLIIALSALGGLIIAAVIKFFLYKLKVYESNV